MKKFTTLSLSLLAIGAFPLATLAAQVAGTATATVQVALTISQSNPLSFGQFLASGSTGTVTVNKDDGTTSHNTVTKVTDGARGSFALTGTPNSAVTIGGDTSVTLEKVGDTSKTMNATIERASNSVTLDGSGNGTLLMGGVLTVGANQSVGSYSGTYSVTALYQ